jgi:hypothetical protein
MHIGHVKLRNKKWNTNGWSAHIINWLNRIAPFQQLARHVPDSYVMENLCNAMECQEVVARRRIDMACARNHCYEKLDACRVSFFSNEELDLS